MNDKKRLNSAFVGYEEICRSRRVLSAPVDITLLDLQNPSYPTQPHSVIANYSIYEAWYGSYPSTIFRLNINGNWTRPPEAVRITSRFAFHTNCSCEQLNDCKITQMEKNKIIAWKVGDYRIASSYSGTWKVPKFYQSTLISKVLLTETWIFKLEFNKSWKKRNTLIRTIHHFSIIYSELAELH